MVPCIEKALNTHLLGKRINDTLLFSFGSCIISVSFMVFHLTDNTSLFIYDIKIGGENKINLVVGLTG